MMNDALAGMIPYDSIGLYEQPKPRFFFKMPRVVPEQKSKFESDELFRRLSRECEVRNQQTNEKKKHMSKNKIKLKASLSDYHKICDQIINQQVSKRVFLHTHAKKFA